MPSDAIVENLDVFRDRISGVFSCQPMPTMGATDVAETYDQALAIPAVDKVRVNHRLQLLSDSSPAYLFVELGEYLGKRALGDAFRRILY
ncbi:MAG TPA: hypothetical protein EYQ54_13060 [Myxococcales bacterium]|nr:hypothetical protein [Myxococcales bacterium]HIL80749.1 hypothetical protein [Myxococcales bacterium]